MEVLSGRGPADTRRLYVALCGLMLAVASLAKDMSEGARLAERALDDGSALRKFAEIIAAQGGDAEVVRRPLEVLPRAGKSFLIKSSRRGVLSKLDTLSVGEALRALGGGRMKLDDEIDRSVAVRLRKKTG
ncbi:thymidine phosphorylase, partial [Cloacibacillus evryensis]|nr:thymidine phosphorylase [Cloacibacillus evryensis]